MQYLALNNFSADKKGISWVTELPVCPTMFTKHTKDLAYDYDGDWNMLVRDELLADFYCMISKKTTSSGFNQEVSETLRVQCFCLALVCL